MLASRGEIEDAAHSATAVLGQLGLPFPFATLFDLQIESDVGDHLIDAREAREISQLCPQHRYRRRSKFWHAQHAGGLGVLIQQLVDLVLQLLQVLLGMVQLITENAQTA
jgi:hypothetical protein